MKVPTPRERRADDYMPFLDGVRGLALLIVLVWHAYLRALRSAPEADQHAWAAAVAWIPRGELGVDLFFFLSAFLIFGHLLARGLSRPADVMRFYAKRFIRISPPYVATLVAAYLALKLTGYAPANAPRFQNTSADLEQSFLASLGYVHGLVFSRPSKINPPVWSLEVEAQFYLLVPLLLVGIRQIKAMRRRLLVGAAAIILYTTCVLAFSAVRPGGALHWSVLPYMPYFLCGCIVADLVGRGKLALPPLVGETAAVIGLTLLLWTGQFEEAVGYTSVLARELCRLLAVMMFYMGCLGGARAQKLLSWTPLLLLGRVSYSVYLVHVPVLQAAAEVMARLPASMHGSVARTMYIPCAIGGAVMAGAVCHFFIERPAMRWSKRFGGRPSGSPAGFP